MKAAGLRPRESARLRRGVPFHWLVLLCVGLGVAGCAQKKYRYSKVCEPPGSRIERPVAGPAVLHALDVAPERLDDGWPVSTLEAEGLDPDRIGEMLRAIEQGRYTKIDSLLIARNGKLLLEAYFNGFERTTKHDLRSASKSFASALVGIALDKGLIRDVDQPISDFFPDHWPDIENDIDQKSRITLAHMLTMTPGFDMEEGWGVGPFRELDMKRTTDWYKFTLDLPMVREPGSQFAYATPTSVLINGAIAEAVGEPTPDFARKHLFGPLGTSDYCWTLTDSGQGVINSSLYLRPRDMLKYGQLHLDDGLWRGQRIVSAEWVKESTRRQVSAAPPEGVRVRRLMGDYGYQWFTNRAEPSDDPNLDMFYASGNGGQKIFVYPTLEMVVVFTGGSYNTWTGHEQPPELLERFILPAVLN